jgi:hypothetical protein
MATCKAMRERIVQDAVPLNTASLETEKVGLYAL